MTRDELLESLADLESATRDLCERIGDLAADLAYAAQREQLPADVPEPLIVAVQVWADDAATSGEDLERELRGLVDRVRT